jgi:hypothetical protein
MKHGRLTRIHAHATPDLGTDAKAPPRLLVGSGPPWRHCPDQRQSAVLCLYVFVIPPSRAHS